MWPAIAHSGALDQTSSRHDGGGEEAGEIDNRGGAFTVGLGLLTGMTVIPHYDLWSPDKRHRTVKLARPDLVVAGIDERTALVRDPQGAWRISGAASAVLYRGGAAVGLEALAGS